VAALPVPYDVVNDHRGMRVWRLRGEGAVLEAELVNCGTWGTEYRLFLNSHFCYSQRFTSHEEAARELAAVKVSRLKAGWR
jgi:hypothetical protein